MLEENYKLLRKCADEIDWEHMDKDELFMKYVYEKDEHMKEVCRCGVIMKYWGWIGIIYNKCDHHLPITDCFDIMMEAVNYVAEKRVWENKDNKLYGKSNAPSIAWFNAIRRQMHKKMAYITADKRRGDYDSVSVDKLHEEFNDAADGVFEDVATDSEFYIVLSDKNMSTFKKILIDLICYGKETYSDLTLAELLKEIDNRNFKHYNSVYGISRGSFDNFIKEVAETEMSNLRRKIRKELYTIGKEYYGEIRKRDIHTNRDMGDEGQDCCCRDSER